MFAVANTLDSSRTRPCERSSGKDDPTEHDGFLPPPQQNGIVLTALDTISPITQVIRSTKVKDLGWLR